MFLPRIPTHENRRARRLRAATCLAASLLFFPRPAGSREPGGVDTTMHVRCEVLLPCRVDIPPGGPGDPPVVVIGLHGNGSTHDDFFAIREFFGDRGFVFVAPRAPYLRTDLLGEDVEGYSWAIQTSDRRLWERADPLTPAYIAEVAAAAVERFRSESIYLLGFSQGASWAYVSGIVRPDLFDGIVAIAGHLPGPGTRVPILDDADMRGGAGLPVLILHGEDDRAIHFREGRAARETLESYGYEVGFRRFGGGHAVPLGLLPDIARWIEEKSAEKKPSPDGE